MRVLMVHDEPIDDGYGAESYLRRLVAGLRDAGDEVEIIVGELRHTGVGRVRDLWDPAARTLVRERSSRFSPDVVHVHNIARELSAAALSATPHIPVVMTVHDLRILGATEHAAASPRGVAEWVGSRILRATARRRLAATIGVTDRVAGQLRRCGFPAVSTVRVPVTLPASQPRPVVECRDVAVIARLAADKGIDLAIDAFGAATSEDRGGRRLLIAGDGPERERLERRAAHLGDAVCFLGRLDEDAVSALIGGVRAVVVASQPTRRPEGSSLTTVEAAMHGRPVVTSDDPALREVASALGNALVVPGSHLDGFTTQLARLLTDDALATELGARGRANAVELHSIGSVAAATREVYRSVVTKAVG
jgi:glycosyltransferase involved in cell wall biosynthesis